MVKEVVFNNLLKLRDLILKFVVKFVDPLTFISAIFSLGGVDFTNRYIEVFRELKHGSVLDIGAGGRSVLAFKGFKAVSLDLRRIYGVDVVASASHLPFRENVFSNVISVDTIEHIQKNNRKTILLEMIHVAREKVVIHSPLDDGETFLGRRYDILFQEWFKKIYGHLEPFTAEHISNIEPHPNLFLDLKFKIRGTHNAKLWLKCMKLSFLPPKLLPINGLIAWIYFVRHKLKNQKPPYWGGICIYEKKIT